MAVSQKDRNCSLEHLQVDPTWNGEPYDYQIEDNNHRGVVDPTAVKDNAGRAFQGTREGTYWLPSDEEEQARLDRQHKLVGLLLNGELGLAPVKDPKHALDIATGTGIWAIDYARRNPGCQVIGNDLALIQPSGVSNCTFERSDVEKDEWNYPFRFDYIHMRFMVSCFDDPKAVIKKVYDHLAPGGYIEFFDAPIDMCLFSGDVEKTGYGMWVNALKRAMVAEGRDPDKVYLYADWLKEAGFVDVEEHIVATPLNPWALAPKQKKIGAMMQSNYGGLMYPLANLMVHTGEPQEKVDELTTGLLNAMADPTLHMYQEWTTVFGRKPLSK